MSTLLRIVIGAVIMIIAALVFPPIGFLMFLAIACTFGVGLIPLFLIAYFIGSMVDSFLPGAAERKAEYNKNHPKKSKTHYMTYYIAKGRDNGISDEEIHTILRNKGWNDEEIKIGFSKV